jgi:hypothetical protein
VEAALVHVADVIADAMQLGTSGEPNVPPFEPEAWAKLELDPMILPVVLEEAEQQLNVAISMFLR